MTSSGRSRSPLVLIALAVVAVAAALFFLRSPSSAPPHPGPPALASLTLPPAPGPSTAAPSAPPPKARRAPPDGPTGAIEGTVRLLREPPVRKVPILRKSAAVCKDKAILSDTIVAKDGLLEDVLVRLAPGSIDADYPPPSEHARVSQVDCLYVPKVSGVIAGQILDIENGDATLHNVHTYRGSESWFNLAQPAGALPIEKALEDEAGVIRLTCDVHGWMRAIVVVSDHPFFTVTGESGAFRIEGVPVGDYELEAVHTTFGSKTTRVSVTAGSSAKAAFEYAGTEVGPGVDPSELEPEP